MNKALKACLFLVMIGYTPLSYPGEIIGPIIVVYQQDGIPCRCATLRNTELSMKSGKYRDVHTFFCITETSQGIVNLVTAPIRQDAYLLDQGEADLTASLLCSAVESHAARLNNH